jgi:hypothetical protein
LEASEGKDLGRLLILMSGAKQSLLLTYFAKEVTLAAEKLHFDQQKEACCQLDESGLEEHDGLNKSSQGTSTDEDEAPPPEPTETRATYSALSSITMAVYLEWILVQIADPSSFGRKTKNVSLSCHLGQERLEREAVAMLVTLGKEAIHLKTTSFC